MSDVTRSDTMKDGTTQHGTTRDGVVRDGVVRDASTSTREGSATRADAGNRDPDQIRQDIRRTRGEMDDTVDELVDRFSVGSVVDEVWQRVRRSSGGGPDVGGLLREHPMPIASMGLGLGWLAVEQASGRSVSTPGTGSDSASGSRWAGGGSSKGRRAHAGRDHDDDGRERQGQGNGRSTSQANGESDEEGFADRLSEKGSEAMDTAREKTDAAKERAKDAGVRARAGFQEMLTESPLTVGSIVFGLGLASGLAVPSSEFEDRKMGGMSDKLKDEAGKIGSKAADRARDVGRTAASAAISESRDQVDRLEDQDSGGIGSDGESRSESGSDGPIQGSPGA
ncbi:hypothetical protein BH23CHL8_BH23CHL8_32160 [soil metagenome]